MFVKTEGIVKQYFLDWKLNVSYVYLIKKNKPRVQILNVAYEKKGIITFSINKVVLKFWKLTP